jgi:subtilisin-like proprotein convertase family protein
VIGALNASGVKASYSSAGSALWVSAPGGEYGWNASVRPGYGANFYMPAMVTADQSGCTVGYARTDANTSLFDRGEAPNGSCNYTNSMNGTSAAAPSASGAIALLLDARPDLGWRDVKHILAKTATRVDPSRPAVTVALTGGNYVAETPWITNGAGYDFHDWYGFGAINVDTAVEMAKTWEVGTLGTFTTRDWLASGVLAVPIPDFNVAGATSTLSIPVPQGLVIEAVQIRWSATHAQIKDLGVQLTSPSGTTSILFNIRSGFEAANPFDMVLLSNAFYGEPSAGNWTIKVVDGRNNGVAGTLTGWQLRIFGH